MIYTYYDNNKIEKKECFKKTALKDWSIGIQVIVTGSPVKFMTLLKTN